MRSPLYACLAAALVFALSVLTACTSNSADTRQRMDERLAWAEAALPFTTKAGFEGAVWGALDASTDYASPASGLGSVPPGDHIVHVACRGDGPVEFRVSGTDNTDLAVTSLDCGVSAALEVTNSAEGLVFTAAGESPADWAVAVMRSPER
jgi:hypothetical protein